MKKHRMFTLSIAFGMILSFACGFFSVLSPPTSVPPSTSIPTFAAAKTLPVSSHLMQPAENAPAPANLIDDVESSGTGPEGRAPYGDSYKLNRFERPFSKDMTYIPDLDIHKFGLSEDGNWYYISILLIGDDPNNTLGIDYGVEIDLNADGFGDYLLWTHPPYTTQWSTNSVQVFKDANLDTAGQSATQSDANAGGNGYDTLVFDGGNPQDADPDLAWVRMSVDQAATVQFAFKKSLTGPVFMLGVLSDGGLKDVSKFDYADHFTEAEAGSSVKNNKHFPLGALYAVDNTCWEAYGIKTTGFEPKLCQPIDISSETQPPSNGGSDLACNPPPDCNGDEAGNGNYNSETCSCE